MSLDHPAAIPARALPFVFMVDVIYGEGEPRLCYRLIGTGITRMAGRDLTGKDISAAYYGEHAEQMQAPFRQVVKTGRALRSFSRTAWDDQVVVAESVYLPLGNDHRVDIVMGATVPLDHGATVEPAGFQSLCFGIAELEIAQDA